MDFLRALVQANIPAFSSSRLLSIFIQQESATSPSKVDTHHKQSYYSLAKCIAVICVSAGEQEAVTVARTFVSDLSRPGTLTDTQIVIALLSVGEIGRHV